MTTSRAIAFASLFALTAALVPAVATAETAGTAPAAPAPVAVRTEPAPAPVAEAAEPAAALAPAQVVAHRGYSGLAPENTLVAIEAARHSGADYIEIDIDFTADGVPVVIHDDTVDRTTDGTGAIREMDYSEVRGLDAGSWFAPAYADEPMPSLEQALDSFADQGGRLLLEYKGGWSANAVAETADMIRDRGLADSVMVQSFDVETVRNLRAEAPELPAGLLRSRLDGDPVAIAEELGVDAYNPNAERLLERPEVVDELQAAGIEVMAYTVNEAAGWQRLTELGVDAIITDHPAQLAGWNRQFAASGAA
ncbi:glycerophosphodiester phosphodiesterase [Allonocardiopsis opalescens]|uniref:Glycerophosphoryl diester phosphodiesterase n=1 Tax=Allonocardiopsis opalescens TaxID=1144618 RepID=A0A2T0Q0B5_9ACTN|nr:glycerophosphodiester phosphodiesterase family protein [Allonocardiopsis opalescens]PRX97224.1 glycerophosphoryl diester phosphodiesterase [Allonocardiopsis opalescens]